MKVSIYKPDGSQDIVPLYVKQKKLLLHKLPQIRSHREPAKKIISV